MRMRLGAAIIFSMALVVGFKAQAENAGENRAAQTENKKTYGGYLSLGNPYPTLFGLNAAYNVNKNVRASVGYGEIEVTTSVAFTNTGLSQKKVKATTYAAGVEYLFMESALRPLLGMHLGYFDVSGDGEIAVSGFKKSTAHLYSNLGIDWVASSGYQLGAGMNLSVAGASGSSFYVNTGYFF